MQERAKITKARILKAATELFSKHGLNGVTVDEIAAAAQVNKQRIYAYYSSKNKLFESALLNIFEQVELFSEKMLSKAKRHPERLTEIVINGFLKVHSAHPDFWRLLAWANLEGPQCANALNQARSKENEQLRMLYEKAVAKGMMQPVKFEIWLFTLLAVTYFRYSNELTLAHTLDCSDPLSEFEKELSGGLNMLFSSKNNDKISEKR